MSTSADGNPHTQEVDEDDESIHHLKDCAQLYLNLQNCLISTDRDWRACQKEVKLLKLCYERQQSPRTPTSHAGLPKEGHN